MYRTDLGASAALTDDAFIEQFESLTLPEPGFKHVDHVRLAWIYLKREGLVGALERVRGGIRRFATHHGAPGKYHETLTCAAVVLVHERMHDSPPDADWPAFAATNPDLLVWKEGAFFELYSPDIVADERARHVFVLPRRAKVGV